jgi:hypothetical protein
VIAKEAALAIPPEVMYETPVVVMLSTMDTFSRM